MQTYFFLVARRVRVALAAPALAFVDLLAVALTVLFAARVVLAFVALAAPAFALVDLLTVAFAVLFAARVFLALVALAAPVLALVDLLTVVLAVLFAARVVLALVALTAPVLALVDLLTVALAVLFAARVVLALVALTAPVLALVDLLTVALAVLFAARVFLAAVAFAAPAFAFVDLLAAGFLAAGFAELFALVVAFRAFDLVAIILGSFEIAWGTSLNKRSVVSPGYPIWNETTIVFRRKKYEQPRSSSDGNCIFRRLRPLSIHQSKSLVAKIWTYVRMKFELFIRLRKVGQLQNVVSQRVAACSNVVSALSGSSSRRRNLN
jgi:hypothetical protein